MTISVHIMDLRPIVGVRRRMMRFPRSSEACELASVGVGAYE